MDKSLTALEQMLASGKALSRIVYDCGCESIGIPPLPTKCPNHKTEPEKYIRVAVILDESGSMSSVRDKTIQGFNEYLNGLEQDGKPYLITLSKFDAHPGDPACRVMYVDQPAKLAPRLGQESYTPRGGTPLYDAIGITVTQMAEKPEQDPGSNLVIILTDGEENSSKDWTKERVQALIKEKEATGNWTFVYLGANQDAWAAAQQFGMQKGNVASFATADVGNVMSNLVRSTGLYACQSMAKGMNPYQTSNYFGDAGIKNVNVHPDVSSAAGQIGSIGGTVASSQLTPQQRIERAQKANRARYSKKAT